MHRPRKDPYGASRIQPRWKQQSLQPPVPPNLEELEKGATGRQSTGGGKGVAALAAGERPDLPPRRSDAGEAAARPPKAWQPASKCSSCLKQADALHW